jgi:hypothetical protein
VFLPCYRIPRGEGVPASSSLCCTLQISNGYVPRSLRLREGVHVVLFDHRAKRQ